MAALGDDVHRLGESASEILSLQRQLEAAGPWALSELYGTEPEASWGPHEVLAHLEEMLRFWMGEVERILAADPSADPVPFGRIADDTIRIGVIGRDRQLPLRVLFERLGQALANTMARMLELTDADAARVGLHPTRGEFDVPALLDRFVVTHMADHATQLREILAARR